VGSLREPDFLCVSEVYKNFGKIAALNGVSFKVDRGESVGLIGPNGAGKTVLFNVVSGFYRATSGKITFKGMDVSHSEPNELAEMGMVRTFQIPKPFKGLTIFDNVAVGTLFNKKFIGRLPIEFVNGILTGVNLYSFKDQLAGILGYGYLKHLELGRAQSPSPDLLLLDEPFAGLTISEIESISKILRNLSEKGMTLIIVEHKLRELMKLVNRTIVLYYGRKIADGRPQDIAKDEQVLKAYLGKRWSSYNA
jgi:branched-chain amino acid transport system ATP-binding protein